MSFLQDVETNTRERVSLSPGSYGTGKEPGLKILQYIDKTSKLDKSGAMRHSFLVAATRPSREAAELQKNAKSNGFDKGSPLSEPDFEGTAFLSVTLHELWLTPEATALAFTEASRNKEGVIQADYVTKAIADGDATQDSIDRAAGHFKSLAADKVLAANTPDDQVQDATDTQYKKELTQISIKVGQFLTLQDWAGQPRDLQFDPLKLVGTQFSGKVETKEFNGKSEAEVSAIWSKKK
jgi:hypothetical protein